MERKKRPLRLAGLKKSRNKGGRRRFYWIAGAAAAVFILLFLIRNRNTAYNSFEINEGAAVWPVSSQDQYVPYKDGIIRYNRDGAEAISQKGTRLWNAAYKMNDPIIDVRGSYAAIADRGNQDLLIINGSGSVSTLQMVQDILLIATSETGLTMVMTDDGMWNRWYLYKHGSSGQSDYAYDGATNVSASGFILDMSLSPDGKKSISEYLKVQDDAVLTWSVFHNYGEVGQNHSDHLVGGFHNSSFASRSYFLTTDKALILKEDGFALFRIPEEPEEPVVVVFEEKVQQIAYSSSMICAAVENKDEKGRRKIYCYALDGRKLSEFYMQDAYDNIMTSGEDIVFYGSTSFYICNSKGELKMKGEFAKYYKHIYPVNNQDKYILVGDGYLDILRLTKGESK